jgi:hypothetical protein
MLNNAPTSLTNGYLFNYMLNKIANTFEVYRDVYPSIFELEQILVDKFNDVTKLVEQNEDPEKVLESYVGCIELIKKHGEASTAAREMYENVRLDLFHGIYPNQYPQFKGQFYISRTDYPDQDLNLSEEFIFNHAMKKLIKTLETFGGQYPVLQDLKNVVLEEIERVKPLIKENAKLYTNRFVGDLGHIIKKYAERSIVVDAIRKNFGVDVLHAMTPNSPKFEGEFYLDTKNLLGKN